MPKQIFHRWFAASIVAIVVGAPAQALDLKRSDVSSFIDKMVSTYQFDRTQLENILRGAETKQPILDAIGKPAEKTTPWFEYRERFLLDKRITRGKSFRTEHQATLDKLANEGAPVAEILGI